MKQRTLRKNYLYEGKGLHTGGHIHMTVKPAPVNTGIRFHRVDLGENAFVDALADNVLSTTRSTTISAPGDITVVTIEHLLAALTGLGVDNAIVELDGVEVPILDGSAKPYIDTIGAGGLVEQEEDRHYITVPREIVCSDPKTGSFVKISPAEEFSYDIIVDFNSKVLGVQSAHWDETVDFTTQIAPCRTFCFFHELEYLASLGLVKGGDIDNAIIVVEHHVSPDQIERLKHLFNAPDTSVTSKGYLSNVELFFENECGRHKLLDLIGDMRLAGGFLKAKISAYKPGHTINTKAVKLI